MAINLQQLHRDATFGDEIFSGCVLPSQFNAAPSGHRLWESERRLLAAVLEDAIRCYLTNCRAKTKSQLERFLEVQAWFNDRRPARAPYGLFSFEVSATRSASSPALFASACHPFPWRECTAGVTGTRRPDPA